MIPQNLPALDGNERRYVLDCLDTNWISSMGKYIPAFEEAFASYCGASYGVACSSGTAALHLVLVALGIGFGDEVIVPDFTLVADANMVILAGARPVFVDVDSETFCLDPGLVEEKITPKTKAILAVHMYGHPCDMDALKRLAAEHELKLIIDAAQAHGSEYRGSRANCLGDVACFSFYATKTLTTGEGGMVVTDDPDLAERCRLLRNQGFEGGGRRYWHRVVAFNYRMTNLQAAIGLAQTERAGEKFAAKRRNAEIYRELLAEVPGIRLPREREWARSTFWNYTVLVEPEFGLSRDQVMEEMSRRGVETRTAFCSLHRQPAYQGEDPRLPDTRGEYPVSDLVSERGLCLPSGVGLSRRDLETVVEVLLACRR